ncbi:MAG: STAS domain-containing protein [Aureispira sp.]
MAYSFSSTNNIEVLQVDDLLNPLDNQEIIKEIEEKIQTGATVYVVDLSEMDYMNSSGLTFLISILTRARNAGGEVAIANLSDNIKKILLVTRLNNMFNVYSSVEEAIEALQPV